MKFEAKYFLILLTFALMSYYGMRTMIMTSNRVESNLGKDVDTDFKYGTHRNSLLTTITVKHRI